MSQSFHLQKAWKNHWNMYSRPCEKENGMLVWHMKNCGISKWKTETKRNTYFWIFIKFEKVLNFETPKLYSQFHSLTQQTHHLTLDPHPRPLLLPRPGNFRQKCNIDITKWYSNQMVKLKSCLHLFNGLGVLPNGDPEGDLTCFLVNKQVINE